MYKKSMQIKHIYNLYMKETEDITFDMPAGILSAYQKSYKKNKKTIDKRKNI